MGVHKNDMQIHLTETLKIDSAHGFAHFLMAQTCLEFKSRKFHFLQFLKNTEYHGGCDKDLWDKYLPQMKTKAYLEIADLYSNTVWQHKLCFLSAKSNYEKGLCCFQNGEMKRNYVAFMVKHFPSDPVTKIIRTLKKNFTLTGNNIRQVCEHFSILTPGFQKYVEKYNPDSFFAMKEFLNLEKQWLITFVHPFCDESFPVAATEEILAFLYPL